MKIKTASAALKAFGPDGTRPIAGVRLAKRGQVSWVVEARNEQLEWETMAHFCSASEVIEWANRF
jgi:hypothetical protein